MKYAKQSAEKKVLSMTTFHQRDVDWLGEGSMGRQRALVSAEEQ